jgi:hypothetical protein
MGRKKKEATLTAEQVIKDVQEGKAKVIALNDGIEGQDNVVVGEVETVKYDEPIKEASEFQQPAPAFTTMDKALQYELFTRLKQLRDGEELDEYCIIDRFNSADFIYALRDGLYAYREDVILCERLYLKSKCNTETKQQYVLPEKAREIAKEFTDYVKNIDFTKLTEEETTVTEAKLKEYQATINSDEMKPQLEDVPVLVFPDNGTNLLVSPLKDIEDGALDSYCGILAKFVLTYFLSMRIMLSTNFVIHVTPVKNGEYIDIIAMIVPQ